MSRLIFVLLVMLAACAPRPIQESAGFRDTASPIYSKAVFDLDRLDGPWFQVAAFDNSDTGECRKGMAEFTRTSKGMQMKYRLCVSGKTAAGGGAIASTGPGRFALAGKTDIGADWWVLWVDESYRTMAIGTPSGAFGFILNRGADLPTDRLNAAREVFDFNGYRTEKLKVFAR